MLSVARLIRFWRYIPVQYNCQKSSNFQGLSHFSRIFGKNDKIPGFFQAGKTVTIFPGFPGAVGTLYFIQMSRLIPTNVIGNDQKYCFIVNLFLYPGGGRLLDRSEYDLFVACTGERYE